MSDVPWDKITHFNYAFIDIDLQNGVLQLFDSHAADINLPKIREYGVRYPNVTTMISIGGWSRSAGFRNAAATPTNRQRFADSCVDFIRRWGFGGVDVDWEYPTARRDGDKIDNPNDQGTPNADISEAETFPLLLKAIREALDRAGQQDGRYYPLTAAVSINPNITNVVRPDTYAQYLDFINLMSYDMHGAWESVTGHHSPLYPNPFAPHGELERTYFNTNAAMKHFESFGIHPNKLVLGVPFYTRGWGQVSKDYPIRNVMHNGHLVDLPGLFAAAPPESVKGEWDGGRNAGTSSFDFAEDVLIGQRGFIKYRDPWARVPYLYNESLGQMFTYDDEISVREKSEYVNQNNYGGIIIWDLSGNRDGRLLRIMNEVMNGSPTVSGEGTLTLRMNGPSYNFVPKVTIGTRTYSVPFGSSQTITLPIGTHEVEVWWARTEDFTTFWNPVYFPKFVQVNRNSNTDLDIHYVQSPEETTPTTVHAVAKLFQRSAHWGGGSYGIDITNQGNTEIPPGWRLTFALNDSTLQLNAANNGVLTRSGNNYTLQDASWVTTGIAPGAIRSFNGEFSGAFSDAVMPDKFYLNGQRIGIAGENVIIVDNSQVVPPPPPPPTDGDIVLNIHSKPYGFVPSFTINGVTHNVAFGQQSNHIRLPQGSYNITFNGHSDFQFNYVAHISPNPVFVTAGQTTIVDVDIEGVPHSGGVTPECFDVSIGSGEDVIHTLNIRVTNNSNATINNWMLEFDFNNVIDNAAPHVTLNRIGSRYSVTSDGTMPDLLPGATATFSVFFRKQLDDVLRNLTMNGKPLCNNLPPQPPALGAPSNLREISMTENSIGLAWNIPVSMANVQGFRVYRNNAVVATMGTGVTSFTDTGLTPNTSYSYRVASFDNLGNEASSNTITASTVQTVPPPVPPPGPEIPGGAPEWNPFGFYNAGDIVSYNGRLYQALITFQGHGDVTWNPQSAPTIWRAL